MTPETQTLLEQLAEKRQRLIDELGATVEGQTWCERHTEVIDQAINALYEDLKKQFSELPPLSIIATGGYGRSELAPYSDIDLTVLPTETASATLDAAVKQLFQNIHAVFGTLFRMEVGYAYRFLSDVPALDPTTRTGLLDARLVAGSSSLYQRLMRLFWDKFPTGEFLLAKIAEREEMFRKHHATPLVVEPNLKEGAGGLRSFQCANWLRMTVGERPLFARPAYDRILGYRNLLHKLYGKNQNILTRQKQSELADLLNVEMYTMMGEISESLLELDAEYQKAREMLREVRIPLAAGVTSIRGEARIGGPIDAGVCAIGIAVATQLGLGVSDHESFFIGSADGPSALFAISQGEATIRNLDRCGLLQELLPEFTDCRTLLSRDSVHHYGVFEHTLNVVRNLDLLQQGNFFGDIKTSLPDPEPLYLAALLHDVGKIDPDRDHDTYSSELARRVCERWKLSPNIADKVVWLVEKHLEMELFIRIRDISRAQTVAEFAKFVGDQERLDLLTLLTYADVKAVSPASWTPAQESFLKDLYRQTAEALRGEAEPVEDAGFHRKRLLRELKESVPTEQLQAFMDSLPAHYVISTSPELIPLHMDFAAQAARGEQVIDLVHEPAFNMSALTVCTLDSPGLLSKILGTLYAMDLRVHELRIFTTQSEPAVALDQIRVSFGGRALPAATAKLVENAMRSVIQGERSVRDLLLARGKNPDRKQELFTCRYTPGQPGVLEVRAPRGRGMPYRISSLIAEKGWEIQTARVGQWAGNAAAAFYITDSDGLPLEPASVESVFGKRSL